MEIRDNDKICIIAPIRSKIDSYTSKRILERIKRESREVAIDLSYVEDCSIEFIEGLKNLSNKGIGVFNIPSDIFVLFNIMNLDKTVKLFVSEIDYKEDARQLVNRRFAVI